MSEHAVWIGTDSDGGYHWHTAHEDRDECLARIRSIVIEEGDVLLVPTFVRVFAQAEGSLAGGEQVRSSEAASQPTPAAVDTAKGGEPKEERLTDERLAELTTIYWTHPQMRSALTELQSHRAAAGREGVIEECARVADEAAEHEREEINETRQTLGKQYDHNSYGAGYENGSLATAENLAEAIRALKKGQS